MPDPIPQNVYQQPGPQPMAAPLSPPPPGWAPQQVGMSPLPSQTGAGPSVNVPYPQSAMVQGIGQTSPVGMGGTGVGATFNSNGARPNGSGGDPQIAQDYLRSGGPVTPQQGAAGPQAVAQGQAATPWSRVFSALNAGAAGLRNAGKGYPGEGGAATSGSMVQAGAQGAQFDPKNLTPQQLEMVRQHLQTMQQGPGAPAPPSPQPPAVGAQAGMAQPTPQMPQPQSPAPAQTMAPQPGRTS